ncbi:MAG: TolC family outer membrane protein [Methylococcaceae bacterium]
MKKLLLLPGLWLLLAGTAQALDLLEAYDLGLRNDPVVLSAEASRNAVLQNKPINRAQLLPSLAFTGQMDEYHVLSFSKNYLYRNIGEQYFWQGSAGFQLTQPIFHYDYWVKFWQSNEQIAEAEARLTSNYQKLATRIAEAYFNGLAADEQVKFTNLQLQSLASQLDQVRERLEVGFSTVVDLDSIQAEYDKVRADLILAEQKREDARESLREIIGGDTPKELVNVPVNLPLKPPEPNQVEAWRDMALQNNLDVVAALNAAEVAKRNIDINYAAHLPTVDLAGQKSFSDTSRIGGISADAENIGVTVRVPLFAGGGINARVVQAQHGYEQALHEVDRLRRLAERQVKDAFRGVSSSISRVKALEAAIKSSESSLAATEMGYRVGTRTVVDIIIEESRLYGSRTEYAKARYDYLKNRLLLKQASGTLMRVDVETLNALLHG